MKITRKRITASASGTVYAPIIGRDLEWFESDVKGYIGKNVASLKRFLKDQDFKQDFTAMDVYGPDTGSETWVLRTEAGMVKVHFVYDSKSVNRPRPKGDTSFSALRNANAGKRIDGAVTSAYVSDEQDPNLIAQEEPRLFSSTQINADAADIPEITNQDRYEETFYDIYINDNPNGNYYETLEDAIETAQEYVNDLEYADDEITVVLEHYLTDARGEIIDWFEDNGDVVWSNNDSLYE